MNIDKEAFKRHHAMVEEIAGMVWERMAKGAKEDMSQQKLLDIAFDTYQETPVSYHIDLLSTTEVLQRIKRRCDLNAHHEQYVDLGKIIDRAINVATTGKDEGEDLVATRNRPLAVDSTVDAMLQEILARWTATPPTNNLERDFMQHLRTCILIDQKIREV